MSKCEAVQHSDQMVCDACALAWDMNDPAPPECENARLNTELKLSKKDAAFYKSCALSGEAPLPGSEPSTAGVGDEKDAAITSYYAEGRRGDRTYLPSRIAWELERTAMGDGHYGNALRVAKDLPCVDAADKSLLDRWATGKQYGVDHISLQQLAIKIDQIGDEHDDYTIPPTDAKGDE